MPKLRSLFSALVISTAIAGLAGCTEDDGTTEAEPELLFVQNPVSEGVYDANSNTLSLVGVENTLVFTDRPFHEAQYMPTETFVSTMWDLSYDDNFFIDPPNAVLTYWSDDQETSVVVELLDASYHDGVVHYVIQPLDDSVEIPAEMHYVSLFIDGWLSDAWHAASHAVSSAVGSGLDYLHDVYDSLTSCTGALSAALNVAIIAATGDDDEAVEAIARALATQAAITAITVAVYDIVSLVADVDRDDLEEVVGDTLRAITAVATDNPMGYVTHFVAVGICNAL